MTVAGNAKLREELRIWLASRVWGSGKDLARRWGRLIDMVLLVFYGFSSFQKRLNVSH